LSLKFAEKAQENVIARIRSSPEFERVVENFFVTGSRKSAALEECAGRLNSMP
jgi:hypothetical protein